MRTIRLKFCIFAISNLFIEKFKNFLKMNYEKEAKINSANTYENTQLMIQNQKNKCF